MRNKKENSVQNISHKIFFQEIASAKIKMIITCFFCNYSVVSSWYLERAANKRKWL